MTTSAQTAPPTLLTYEAYMQEYLTEPSTNQPYEIIDGVRTYLTGPLWRHQRIAMNGYDLLRGYEKSSGRGLALIAPFDLLIRKKPLHTRQPDMFFISHVRLERVGGPPAIGPLEVAPELVVEVLSPSETRCSLQGKIDDFRQIGVDECWVIDPKAETVEQLRLTEEGVEVMGTYGHGETLRSLAFPDLSLPVSGLFAA